MDYVYCYLSYYGYKVGKATMDGFWAEMDAARQGPQSVPRRLRADRRRSPRAAQQAIDLYTEAGRVFLGRCLHVDPRFAAPPGYTTEATQRVGIESQVSAGRRRGPLGKHAGRREMKDIVDSGYIIIGSPDEVVEQIGEVATNLNVGHLMLLMQFGNMSKELTQVQHQAVRREGDAEAEDMFSEWEHRWWPKPMADGAARGGAGLHAEAPRAE